ncbi:hypothetical protein BDP67DRAFT_528723 [Colletotrichum lupini]|nr:hypothetical protein BDP67DRAFT_528723 [Colletotrichum lupini]
MASFVSSSPRARMSICRIKTTRLPSTRASCSSTRLSSPRCSPRTRMWMSGIRRTVRRCTTP